MVALLFGKELRQSAPETRLFCLSTIEIHERLWVKRRKELRQTTDARAVEPLVTALQNENEDVRYTAAEALGKIGDVRAVKPLTAALQDGEGRRAAAEAIGKIRDAQAESPS